MGIEAELICGHLTYDNKVCASIHFWTVFDGKEYDPTRSMTMYYARTRLQVIVDIDKFAFHKGKEMVLCAEDQTMMGIFKQIQRNREYVEKYLNEAPTEGKIIRAKINERVKKLTCIMNK